MLDVFMFAKNNLEHFDFFLIIFNQIRLTIR